MKKRFALSFAATALALLAATAACTPWGNEMREVTAERLARPAFMVERKIEANRLNFQLWERMHQRYAPANIYIEGDGNTIAFWDSTPTTPVGLHLASMDNAENLGWISRPCQYQEVPDDDVCDPKNWSTQRFSPKVIAAYNDIIDDMVKRYDLKGINLIGYDGGANIAAVIASQRKDVLSLRTVAGDLSPDQMPQSLKTKLGSGNVLAASVAPQISGIPQHHFLGGRDKITTPAMYQSFRGKMTQTGCIRETTVPDADHQVGWVEKWPELLALPVACPAPPEADMPVSNTGGGSGILPDDYAPASFPPVPEDIDHGQK